MRVDQQSDRQIGLLRCNCISRAGAACAELKRTSATISAMSANFGRTHHATNYIDPHDHELRQSGFVVPQRRGQPRCGKSSPRRTSTLPQRASKRGMEWPCHRTMTMTSPRSRGCMPYRSSWFLRRLHTASGGPSGHSPTQSRPLGTNVGRVGFATRVSATP